MHLGASQKKIGEKRFKRGLRAIDKDTDPIKSFKMISYALVFVILSFKRKGFQLIQFKKYFSRYIAGSQHQCSPKLLIPTHLLRR